MNKPTSLMFATFNRLDLTKVMMESLFKNTDVPFRVIIVDNGSTDGTVDWLKNFDWKCNNNCQTFDVQYNEQNKGIAIARNQGLKIADRYKDKWLSTLDNDIELPPGWLFECVSFLSANQNFAIGLNMEGIQYPLKTFNGKTIQYKEQGNLGTACTVFSRKLHEKIGYFITDYGLYSCEDSDYFFRARLAGYKMGYLVRMGSHLGQGEVDTGEYREFKDKCHNETAPKFRQSCSEYVQGKRSIFIDFKE